MQIVKRIPLNLIVMTAPSSSITTIPKWICYGTSWLLPIKNTFLEGISIRLYLNAIISVRHTDNASTTTMDASNPKRHFDYFAENPNRIYCMKIFTPR
jgi:hypothetical protein